MSALVPDVSQFGPGGLSILTAYPFEDVPATTRALIIEAARAKDRLDRLALLSTGAADHFFQLLELEPGSKITVLIDGVVSEQRQLLTVFRQTIAEIDRRLDTVEQVDDDAAAFADILNS